MGAVRSCRQEGPLSALSITLVPIMKSQIESTLHSTVVRQAAAGLESALQAMNLSPQQQLAAVALLAAKQASVLPEDARTDAGQMVGDLVEMALSL